MNAFFILKNNVNQLRTILLCQHRQYKMMPPIQSPRNTTPTSTFSSILVEFHRPPGSRPMRHTNIIGLDSECFYLSKQDLVGVWPIGISGVEEGDAGLKRVLDYGDPSFLRNRGVVYSSEAHAPEAKLGHLYFTSHEPNRSKPQSKPVQLQENHSGFPSAHARLRSSFSSPNQPFPPLRGHWYQIRESQEPLASGWRRAEEGAAIVYLKALPAQLHPGHFPPFHLRICAQGEWLSGDWGTGGLGAIALTVWPSALSDTNRRQTLLELWSVRSTINCSEYASGPPWTPKIFLFPFSGPITPSV